MDSKLGHSPSVRAEADFEFCVAAPPRDLHCWRYTDVRASALKGFANQQPLHHASQVGSIDRLEDRCAFRFSEILSFRAFSSTGLEISSRATNFIASGLRRTAATTISLLARIQYGAC